MKFSSFEVFVKSAVGSFYNSVGFRCGNLSQQQHQQQNTQFPLKVNIELHFIFVPKNRGHKPVVLCVRMKHVGRRVEEIESESELKKKREI